MFGRALPFYDQNLCMMHSENCMNRRIIKNGTRNQVILTPDRRYQFKLMKTCSLKLKKERDSIERRQNMTVAYSNFIYVTMLVFDNAILEQTHRELSEKPSERFPCELIQHQNNMIWLTLKIKKTKLVC